MTDKIAAYKLTLDTYVACLRAYTYCITDYNDAVQTNRWAAVYFHSVALDVLQSSMLDAYQAYVHAENALLH